MNLINKRILTISIISIISAQLTFAPYSYSEEFEIRKSLLIAMADDQNERMKEIEEMEQRERRINEKELRVKQGKSMELYGKIFNYSGWGIGIGGGIYGIMLMGTSCDELKRDSDGNITDECSKKLDEEKVEQNKKNGLTLLVGSVLYAAIAIPLGKYLIKKGQKLHVSFDTDESGYKYYVSYQFQF